LRGLTYHLSLTCRGNLNGIQPVVGAADEGDETKGTKAEGQESQNRAANEHLGLLEVAWHLLHRLETDHVFTLKSA
jgi:hypothetical protein